MHRPKPLLVTSALPYANGPIHLGHLVEYIQTDIWVRFQKLLGNDCVYVCADDAHGAPIMLRAASEGISPEQLVARIGKEHRADFADFLIAFDNYHSTHSDENRELAEHVYSSLRVGGNIAQYPVTQAFDQDQGMFLADRYVRGDCPRCGAADQYGDSCEACGGTYTPRELGNPRSALSGATPEWRESEHYFFKLDGFTGFLTGWAAEGHLQQQVANKIGEWFEAGLRDWDISRDAPYFGFPIPGAAGKYFYVWLDAPIGYMASYWNLLKSQRRAESLESFRDAWNEREITHFIGKDILYFHALFWPAMLRGAGFATPHRVFAHGFLTVDGQKMSKSRGTFIEARTYLEHLNPEFLRYYFAAKLGPGIDDLDLNFDDLLQRVNADLIGKLVNIPSRLAGFVARGFEGVLGDRLDREDIHARFVAAGDRIASYYEAREYSKAVRDIMSLADEANQYIAESRPWELAKKNQSDAKVLSICTLGLNLFRLLAIYLSPVLPTTAANSAAFLNMPSLEWRRRDQALCNHRLEPFNPLMRRLDPADIAAIRASTRTA